jgi:hypothetical protein
MMMKAAGIVKVNENPYTEDLDKAEIVKNGSFWNSDSE